MRNREIIIRKLENIESNISKFNFYLNKQTEVSEYKELIDTMRDNINQAKDFLSLEPMTGDEYNKIN